MSLSLDPHRWRSGGRAYGVLPCSRCLRSRSSPAAVGQIRHSPRGVSPPSVIAPALHPRASQTVTIRTDRNFQRTATGNGSLSYQWPANAPRSLVRPARVTRLPQPSRATAAPCSRSSSRIPRQRDQRAGDVDRHRSRDPQHHGAAYERDGGERRARDVHRRRDLQCQPDHVAVAAQRRRGRYLDERVGRNLASFTLTTAMGDNAAEFAHRPIAAA